MILELMIKMPIMCTKNNSRPKEVANGTLGHVIGYRLPENVITHHQVIDESFGYIVIVSSTWPATVFIKLLNHDQVLDPKLSPDVIGIHPILEHEVIIKFPNWSFIVSIEQIPIVPTFVLIIDAKD